MNNNTHHILVDTFCLRLINLHNELRREERIYFDAPASTESMPTDRNTNALNEILDRYDMSGLKGTMVFETEED